MLFALVNGEKVGAQPNKTGICPLCQKEVFSKCGDINVWHWAHRREKTCDNWYEPETEWHKNWKYAFGKERCEKIISKNGTSHIADIFTENNLVIELQNSPIQTTTIRKREDFYGHNMIWIINGVEFLENFVPFKSKLEEDNEFWNRNNPLAKDYGKVDERWKDNFLFTWKKCRKSWTEAKRHVFIDFGYENLFLVIEGMGTNRGKVKGITKEKFMIEHGGNLELLSTVINR